MVHFNIVIYFTSASYLKAHASQTPQVKRVKTTSVEIRPRGAGTALIKIAGMWVGDKEKYEQENILFKVGR